MKAKRRAFTMVELLVVIAIIAILAGLLFPVLSSAKRSAKTSSALTQLSQIGHGIALYAADHDDYLPFASGNNCFSLAVNHRRGCGAFDVETVESSSPLNAALVRYRIPWEGHRSPVDTMSRVLLQEPGHKPTWFEETTTPRYPGSSYEYTALGLKHTAVTALASSAKTPLVTSLYRIGEGSQGIVHVQFADGHTKATPGGQLGGSEG